MIFIVFKMNKCQKWKRLRMQAFTLTNMTFPAPKPCGKKMKTNIDIEKRPLAGIFIWQYDVSSSKIVQFYCTCFCFDKNKNSIFALNRKIYQVEMKTNVGKWKRLRMQAFTLTNMTFPAPKPCGECHIYFCKAKIKNNDCVVVWFWS